jgi:hypothetical protein
MRKKILNKKGSSFDEPFFVSKRKVYFTVIFSEITRSPVAAFGYE